MPSLQLEWQGVSQPMRLDRAPEVADALRQAAPGWVFQQRQAGQGQAPIHLWRTLDGYRQISPALNEPLPIPSAASAACSLIADLVPNFLIDQPELIGLHCGSVLLGDQLVLFPASHRAGKSTLSAAFACAGHRVFGDDVLGLSVNGEGVALGVAPRLRLPLPASLPKTFTDFVAAHCGPGDDRYQYLALPETQLARHGERAPVGAIVLLEREAGASASLLPLAPGDGLLQLLCQNFAEDWPIEPLFAPLLDLVRRVPCWLLRYSDPLEAVDVVAQAMATQQSESSEAPAAAYQHWQAQSPIVPVPLTAIEGRWCPTPSWHEWPLGEELFMISTQPERAGDVHRLNPVAAGVWRLLMEEPLAPSEVGSLLAETFPATSQAQIERDTRRLFSELAAVGLIAPLMNTAN